MGQTCLACPIARQGRSLHCAAPGCLRVYVRGLSVHHCAATKTLLECSCVQACSLTCVRACVHVLCLHVCACKHARARCAKASTPFQHLLKSDWVARKHDG